MKYLSLKFHKNKISSIPLNFIFKAKMEIMWSYFL